MKSIKKLKINFHKIPAQLQPLQSLKYPIKQLIVYKYLEIK